LIATDCLSSVNKDYHKFWFAEYLVLTKQLFILFCCQVSPRIFKKL